MYRDKGLKYSWDNLREDGKRILARVDKVYVFQDHSPQPSRIIDKYRIRGDIGLLDHMPISISLKLGQWQKKITR